ncbi:MAG: Hpt domain-containing protein, partial [Humidesulfovibrio sp.]|nr:Hpt domain-containing protein [Humidesulfovibrio sp.]
MTLEINDLVQGFVEDCHEHLDHIEAALMDVEAAGDNQDPELVNSVFRAAHSIKGGAGMLGLD